MAKTEKPIISKNSPEAIANEKPIRIDWTEAEKNHPILSSFSTCLLYIACTIGTLYLL